MTNPTEDRVNLVRISKAILGCGSGSNPGDEARTIANQVLLEEKERTALHPFMAYKNGDQIGDLMTLDEFRENVECGGFIDYDGSGYLAMKDGESQIKVYPSTFEEVIRFYTQFTHVCWYNR